MMPSSSHIPLSPLANLHIFGVKLTLEIKQVLVLY